MTGTIITEGELERMRASIFPPPETDLDGRRRRLRALSEHRVASWPNTLEALRSKKENWKREHEEEEEARRREVDCIDAAVQRKLRMETIKKANDRLYEQTDRMKVLRSVQLYSEVVSTRAEQIGEKEARRQALKQRNEAFAVAIARSMAEADKDEAAAKERRMEKARTIAALQQEQLAEYRSSCMARLAREKAEGDERKTAAVAAVAAEKSAAAAARAAARTQLEKMFAANLDLRAVKAAAAARDAAETEKCAREKEGLERVARARRELEARRFAERQTVRQRMIARACAELAARRDESDAREAREAAEQQQRADAEEARREDMRRRQRDAIDRSR
ncbi:unnamed protein product, partial [Phaeothamnion confervicola]